MKEKFLRELADIQTGPFGSQLHKEDYVADEHFNPTEVRDLLLSNLR